MTFLMWNCVYLVESSLSKQEQNGYTGPFSILRNELIVNNNNNNNNISILVLFFFFLEVHKYLLHIVICVHIFIQEEYN